MPWTPYADLDELIEEMLGHWRRILGEGLAGAWIQGSFALGAADLNLGWLIADGGEFGAYAVHRAHVTTHPPSAI